LNTISGSVKSTIQGALGVFSAVRNRIPHEPDNIDPAYDVSVPVLQQLYDMLADVDKVINCSQGNRSDCVGVTKLFKYFEQMTLDYAQELAVGERNQSMLDVIESIKNISRSLDKAFASKDQSDLNGTGLVIGKLLGRTSVDKKSYDDISLALNLFFDASKYALKCEGKIFYLISCHVDTNAS